MSQRNSIVAELVAARDVSHFRYLAKQILTENPELIDAVIAAANRRQFAGLQGELRNVRLTLTRLEDRQKREFIQVAFRKCKRITSYHHYLSHLQNLAAHARSRR